MNLTKLRGQLETQTPISTAGSRDSGVSQLPMWAVRAEEGAAAAPAPQVQVLGSANPPRPLADSRFVPSGPGAAAGARDSEPPGVGSLPAASGPVPVGHRRPWPRVTVGTAESESESESELESELESESEPTGPGPGP